MLRIEGLKLVQRTDRLLSTYARFVCEAEQQLQQISFQTPRESTAFDKIPPRFEFLLLVVVGIRVAFHIRECDSDSESSAVNIRHEVNVFPFPFI